MPPNESPSVWVAQRGHLGSDPLSTVVWVRGDHDIATRVHLSDTIDQAGRLDDADIIVDLSGVTFMDASTVGALVVAHKRSRASSLSLSVRAPSPPARRLLDLCGLGQLIDEHLASAEPPVATALRSWVDVRTQHRGPDSAPPPVDREAASQEPDRITARRRVETADSVQQPRAVS